MPTNVPMFTSEAEAAAWTQPLPAAHVILAGEAGYWSAAGAVQDACEADCMRGIDPDDDLANEEARKRIYEAVNNEWAEGLSHDEWCAAVRRRLGC